MVKGQITLNSQMKRYIIGKCGSTSNAECIKRIFIRTTGTSTSTQTNLPNLILNITNLTDPEDVPTITYNFQQIMLFNGNNEEYLDSFTFSGDIGPLVFVTIPALPTLTETKTAPVGAPPAVVSSGYFNFPTTITLNTTTSNYYSVLTLLSPPSTIPLPPPAPSPTYWMTIYNIPGGVNIFPES
jgi:hypothetical protein